MAIQTEACLRWHLSTRGTKFRLWLWRKEQPSFGLSVSKELCLTFHNNKIHPCLAGSEQLLGCMMDELRRINPRRPHVNEIFQLKTDIYPNLENSPVYLPPFMTEMFCFSIKKGKTSIRITQSVQNTPLTLYSSWITIHSGSISDPGSHAEFWDRKRI